MLMTSLQTEFCLVDSPVPAGDVGCVPLAKVGLHYRRTRRRMNSRAKEYQRHGWELVRELARVRDEHGFAFRPDLLERHFDHLKQGVEGSPEPHRFFFIATQVKMEGRPEVYSSDAEMYCRRRTREKLVWSASASRLRRRRREYKPMLSATHLRPGSVIWDAADESLRKATQNGKQWSSSPV